jgi:hypothetical protein
MTDNFLSAPMADIVDLTAKAAAGDAAAAEYFFALFPASACFLCDSPTGERPTSIAMPDPAAPGMAILSAICTACAALAPAERDTKALRIAKAMWPQKKWTIRRDANPAWLRGSRRLAAR